VTGSGDFRWESSGLAIVASSQIMKPRIHPRFHGPLAALGFLLIMAIVAIIESIGGSF